MLRTLYCLVTTFATARRRQAGHARMLRMLAVRDERLGVLVLDHPAPACYCLPGGDIVITSGALSRLDGPQLEAVLQHERAHLSGRHHLIIALATAVRRTVPRVRLLSYAEAETRRLVELIADDAAVARTGARTVVAALAAIGTGHAEPPEATLGIGSSPLLTRVQRLLGLDRALSRRGRIASRAAVGVLALLPVLLLTISARSLLRECPPDPDDAGRPGAAVVRVVTR
ncbi:M56 family metallopeptidase [Catenulispora yoronensis]